MCNRLRSPDLYLAFDDWTEFAADARRATELAALRASGSELERTVAALQEELDRVRIESTERLQVRRATEPCIVPLSPCASLSLAAAPF